MNEYTSCIVIDHAYLYVLVPQVEMPGLFREWVTKVSPRQPKLNLTQITMLRGQVRI